ncbi:MAG: hypothetical protein IPG76_00090 [Acidobacteria bacterium]|nr:hypothetical protein [Acidobacteriota bacterium]
MSNKIAYQALQAAIACVLLSLCASTLIAQNADTQTATTKTQIPQLFERWKEATAGADATDDDARRIAEGYRSKLPNYDPFTPLAHLTYSERLAKGERVVWEDDALMALVDFGNRGSKLLVVPKYKTNFLTDLTKEQMARVSLVAAAVCDALIVAAGRQPGADDASLKMYVNPPTAVGVRQMRPC